MGIKYVLCDLDGTLLKENREVTQTELESIEKIRNKGIGFVVCTGRSSSFCLKHLEKLGVLGNRNETVICSTGSAIINGLLEPVDVKNIKYNDLLKIIDYTDEKDIFTGFCAPGENYFLDKFRDDEEKLAFYDNSCLLSKDELKERLKSVNIIKVMSHIFEKDIQEEMVNDLLPKLEDCEWASSYAFFVDINRKLDVKDKGLTYFCRAMGCNREEILAIGDNAIDESLLANAGLSACPANAEKRIKELADYVSPYDCNHGAVSDILNKLLLKEETWKD